MTVIHVIEVDIIGNDLDIIPVTDVYKLCQFFFSKDPPCRIMRIDKHIDTWPCFSDLCLKILEIKYIFSIFQDHGIVDRLTPARLHNVQYRVKIRRLHDRSVTRFRQGKKRKVHCRPHARGNIYPVFLHVPTILPFPPGTDRFAEIRGFVMIIIAISINYSLQILRDFSGWLEVHRRSIHSDD